MSRMPRVPHRGRKERDAGHRQAALISAVARNCNSGFKVLAFDNRVLDNGKGPVMLEPVKATIRIGGHRSEL